MNYNRTNSQYFTITATLYEIVKLSELISNPFVFIYTIQYVQFNSVFCHCENDFYNDFGAVYNKEEKEGVCDSNKSKIGL